MTKASKVPASSKNRKSNVRKLPIPRGEESGFDVWVSGRSSIEAVEREILKLVENPQKRKAIVHAVGKGISTASAAVVQAKLNALCEVKFATCCGTVQLPSEHKGRHPLMPTLSEKKGNFIKITVTAVSP
eukprot:TRINITY_DN34641_c0_g1_i1.p1 TRINITY_DN34641_c0_g1~~TRINITY_DN34641_c0_g1_i1.p1  ORF type:complete len:130 (+),score=11.84 TRINITY_DN34641_c0_g1_i1:113-502(+)